MDERSNGITEERGSEIIQKVQREIKRSSELYERLLIELVDHITAFNPDYIFFLDRSARPIWWMIKSYFDESGVTLPKVRFISVSRYKQQPLNYPNNDLLDYRIPDSSKLLIVDEFSESFEGMRNVDFAEEVAAHMGKELQIETHVFMNRGAVGGIPAFYRVLNSEEKSLFYGIMDTVRESLISKPSTKSPYVIRKAYRNIFKEFGKQLAIKERSAAN